MKQIIIIILGAIAVAVALFRQGPAQRGIRRDFKKDANKPETKKP